MRLISFIKVLKKIKSQKDLSGIHLILGQDFMDWSLFLEKFNELDMVKDLGDLIDDSKPGDSISSKILLENLVWVWDILDDLSSPSKLSLISDFKEMDSLQYFFEMTKIYQNRLNTAAVIESKLEELFLYSRYYEI